MTTSQEIAARIDKSLRDMVTAKGLNYDTFAVAFQCEARIVFAAASKMLDRGERIDLCEYLTAMLGKSLALIPQNGDGYETVLVSNLVGRIASDLGIPATLIVPGLSAYVS